MKRMSIVLALLLAVLAPLPGAAGEERVLYVYTWEDYFAPPEIEAFERANGCRVEFGFYDSNETMHETLLTGGGYDVVTPAPNIASSLRENGILAPIDHALLPNLANIDRDSPCSAEDPEMTHTVPYTVTVTGIGYNRLLTPPEAVGGWDIFDNSRIGKNMAMLNDMRETIGAGLKYLGHSINSTNPDEVRAAGKVVSGWKRNLVLFDVEQAKADLDGGMLTAIQAYSGDMSGIMRGNPDIEFFIPREGSAINADVFAILSDTENARLAHSFINHFLDAGVAANNMAHTGYYMPNKAALAKMDEAARRNIVTEFPAACELIRSMGDARDVYDQVWADILIGDGE
ncbi:MAG: spermidine/putrescine ABC transporter substrate-binding protein [Planctomycetota bacterium]|jgi:spermidine/putrescine transport system substrate-binding protein|nr:spermidine/putrescine ABC transporter substrate-binding protein [Planctomycetota bacterium]